MAAAPQTFEEFRRLHPGVKNLTLLKASWDRLVSARQATPAAAAPATAPAPTGAPVSTYTPGALDDVAQADMGAARLAKDNALAEADLAYGQTEANLNKQIPLIEQQRTDNINTNTQNHAARGTLRSGLKAVDRGRIETDALRARTDVADQIAQAAARRDFAKRSAESGFTVGSEQIRAAGNYRTLQDRLASFTPNADQVAAATPAVAAPATSTPAATAKPAPTMSYAQFVKLHGGTSTPALSAAWKKRFGG